MGKSGHKVITVSQKTYDKFEEYRHKHHLSHSETLTAAFNSREAERVALVKFANKITKIPETVRRYT